MLNGRRTMQGPITLPNHLSPARIAVLSSTFIVLLTFIPIAAYENALREPNYMFGDLLTYTFIGVCLISFLVGTMAISSHRRPVNERGDRSYSSSSLFPVWIAVFSALLASVSLVTFIGKGGSFLSALTAGQGNALREAALENASSGVTPLTVLPVGVPLLVWAVYRSISLERGRQVIYLSAVLYGIVLVLVLQRNILIPFVFSVAVVLSGVKFHKQGISLSSAFKVIILLAGFVVAAFWIIGAFRGTGSGTIATSFMGYVPASANRLAALLHGHYDSAFSGHPVFSFRFLWYPPLIRRFLPMSGVTALAGVPLPVDTTQLWRTEFTQVSLSGLNPNYIWSTAFGYTFYDFKWFSCIYFFAAGIFAKYSWRQFIRQTPFGIISYSYICSSIALWGTDNFLSFPQIWLYGFVIIFVWVFDRRSRANESKAITTDDPSRVEVP